MAVPPGHGPFSGFPGPQEHTQVCVQLAPHLPGVGGGWDRRVLGVKDILVAQISFPRGRKGPSGVEENRGVAGRVCLESQGSNPDMVVKCLRFSLL